MTQRELIGRAVAIFLLLMVAASSIVGGVLGAVVERTPAVLAGSSFVALALIFLAFKAWSSAPDGDGEDLFSGQKGLLLSLMIVFIVLFSVVEVLAVIDPDVWRKFVDGAHG